MVMICESIRTSIREHFLRRSFCRGIDKDDYVYELRDGQYEAVFV